VSVRTGLVIETVNVIGMIEMIEMIARIGCVSVKAVFSAQGQAPAAVCQFIGLTGCAMALDRVVGTQS
jgi:hypothetical protein